MCLASHPANRNAVKASIKKIITAHPSLHFFLPAGKFLMGLPSRFRNVFFREILRARLFGLFLTQRRPLLLFVRYGGIGDILCSLPAYAAACWANPRAQGVFITLAEFKCLPDLAKAPGLVCPSRVHCSIPRFPAWMVARVFTPHYTDELGRQSSHAHLIADFFSACGFVPNGTVPRFSIGADMVEKIRVDLGIHSGNSVKTVVIHTGPSWKVREWPVEHWQELVDGLRAAASVRILQIGAHRHVTVGAAPAAALGGVESLVGQLSLEKIAALLSVADLFIGIDSGMLHMAGAAGAACVGIFGPTNPAFRIFPGRKAVGLSHSLPCSFCHHRQPCLHFQSGCPHDIACMKLLKSETVLKRCLHWLSPATSCA